MKTIAEQARQLDLRGVESGIYNFAALPLKIAGGDGAPVRAVLWCD
jgi:kynurenine formamidase